MMRKLLSALILAGIAWAGQVAFAADGTITFAGAVSSDTCTVNGGVAGSSFTVVLPPIASASLAAVSASAGRTPFDIVLSACSTPSGAVHTFFEAGLSTDSETGHLKNTGGAGTGVQIRLLNGDETRFADQIFLRERVWPTLRQSVLCHDERFGFHDARPFPAHAPIRWQTRDFHVGSNASFRCIEGRSAKADGERQGWTVLDEAGAVVCRYRTSVQGAVLVDGAGHPGSPAAAAAWSGTRPCRPRDNALPRPRARWR